MAMRAASCPICGCAICGCAICGCAICGCAICGCAICGCAVMRLRHLRLRHLRLRHLRLRHLRHRDFRHWRGDGRRSSGRRRCWREETDASDPATHHSTSDLSGRWPEGREGRGPGGGRGGRLRARPRLVGVQTGARRAAAVERQDRSTRAGRVGRSSPPSTLRCSAGVRGGLWRRSDGRGVGDQNQVVAVAAEEVGHRLRWRRWLLRCARRDTRGCGRGWLGRRCAQVTRRPTAPTTTHVNVGGDARCTRRAATRATGAGIVEEGVGGTLDI